MIPRHLSLVIVLIIAPLHVATSQTIRGQRIDSIGGHEVPGGFIVLLDSADREVSRTLAGSRGRFVFLAPVAGTYRLRSERIGYRASMSPPFQVVTGETRDYAFRVTPIPVQLAAIEVRDERRCGTRPGEDGATAAVWEEVRKALSAATWSAQQRGYATKILRYERDLDADRRRVQGEQIRTRSVQILKNPFSSIPANELAAAGFIVERDKEIWYYAPDAEVLLDDAFLSTHCFHVVRGSREHGGLIGLAFEPAPGRRLPDVDGVLWLDLETAELRSLEYRYTNMVYDVRDDRVGGTVEFLQLPSGMWIVREWQIRIPRVALEGMRDALADRPPRATIVAFHDTGGEVFEISAHQGVPVYRASVARIVGRIIDNATDGPPPQALVTIEGLDFSTVADSLGAFELNLPLDGKYAILVEHPRLDSIGIGPLRRDLSLKRGSTERVRFEIPSPEHIHSDLCPRDRSDERALFGVVRRGRPSTPIPGAAVTASWQRIEVAAGVMSFNDAERLTRADDSGFFVVCGLPVARPIQVRSQAGGLVTQTASVVFSPDVDGSVLLAWDKPVGAPYEHTYTTPHRGFRLDLVVTARVGVATTPSVPLSGVVVDAGTAEPLAAVRVSVNAIDTTLTRVDGTFGFEDLKWSVGAQRITFRRLGYERVVHEIAVDGADTIVVLNVPMQPLAVQLEEVVVAGERRLVPPYLREFYERRAGAWGSFLDAEEIAQRSAPRVLDILRTISGVELRGDRQNSIYLRRANPRCQGDLRPPIIVLDGIPFGGLLAGAEVGDLLDAINVHDVVGIEVYHGPSEIPPKFNRMNSECGIIVIWTQ